MTFPISSSYLNLSSVQGWFSSTPRSTTPNLETKNPSSDIETSAAAPNASNSSCSSYFYSFFSTDTLNKAKEGLLINNERRDVANLLHTIKNKKFNPNEFKMTNETFNHLNQKINPSETSFIPFAGINSIKSAEINPDDKSKLNKILTPFTKYIEHLSSDAENTNIQESTIEFFNKLLSNCPESKINDAKKSLNEIIDLSSKISNEIEVQFDSVYQTINGNNDISSEVKNIFEEVDYSQKGLNKKYFNECEKFVKLILIDLSSETEELAKQIEKAIAPMITASGMLLTYQEREFKENLCIWIKRLFVPICFIVHQLTGMVLELKINPALFASWAETAGKFGSYALAYIVGFQVIKLVECFSNSTLHAGKSHFDAKVAANKASLKDELELPLDDKIDMEKKSECLFLNSWCEAFSSNLKNWCGANLEVILPFVNWHEYFHHHDDHNNAHAPSPQPIEEINPHNDHNNANAPTSAQTIKTIHLESNRVKEIDDIIEFAFSAESNLSKDEKEEFLKKLVSLFTLQHLYTNCSEKIVHDHDSKEKMTTKEKEKLSNKLNEHYTDITEILINVRFAHAPTPPNGEEKSNFLKPGELKNYSEKQMTSTWNSFLQTHAGKAVYGLFDFFADSMSVEITNKVEAMVLDANLKYLIEISGCIVLPLVTVVPLGILALFYSTSPAAWNNNKLPTAIGERVKARLKA